MFELPPAVLHALVCPLCHGALTRQNANLHCPTCDLDYPVRNGVPIMMVPGWGQSLEYYKSDKVAPKGVLKNLSEHPVAQWVTQHLVPGMTFAPRSGRQRLLKMMEDVPEAGRVLNAGSGTIRYTDTMIAMPQKLL